nr:transposon TX1 [Tanacetum cinerariifolium]
AGERDQHSYREVAGGKRKGVCNRCEETQGKNRKIILNKGIIGEVRDLEYLDKLPELCEVEGLENVEIKLLGRLKVMLVFDTENIPHLMMWGTLIMLFGSGYGNLVDGMGNNRSKQLPLGGKPVSYGLLVEYCYTHQKPEASLIKEELKGKNISSLFIEILHIQFIDPYLLKSEYTTSPISLKRLKSECTPSKPKVQWSVQEANGISFHIQIQLPSPALPGVPISAWRELLFRKLAGENNRNKQLPLGGKPVSYGLLVEYCYTHQKPEASLIKEELKGKNIREGNGEGMDEDSVEEDDDVEHSPEMRTALGR